jgi:DNA-binding transcriptional ArsR family regulator
MTSISVDAYVVDTLMADLIGHDRLPSAFCVYLLLWRHTHGVGAPSVQLSLYDLATGTGLSKRAVQEALRWLSKRKLISLSRESITAIPVYTVKRPWVRAA